MSVLQLIDEESIIAQEKLFAQKFFTRYDGGPINQLESTMESIRINTNNRTALLVDEHEGGVWLHMYVANGSMYVSMTKEQARELIFALQQVAA
jgi:hypothetical protein